MTNENNNNIAEESCAHYRDEDGDVYAVGFSIWMFNTSHNITVSVNDYGQPIEKVYRDARDNLSHVLKGLVEELEKDAKQNT